MPSAKFGGNDWPYYSGVVFEAYASGESTPVAVGGRYDTLAARFGSSRPSVGFAVSLGVLHRALGTRGRFANTLHDGVVVAEGLREGLPAAEAIRAIGITAIAVPGGVPEAESTAAAQSWRFVASIREGVVELTDRSSGRSDSGADAFAVLRGLFEGRQ